MNATNAGQRMTSDGAAYAGERSFAQPRPGSDSTMTINNNQHSSNSARKTDNDIRGT